MKSVLVPLAQGFEEIEAVTVIDILRRAELEVVAAGLEHGPVRGSRGIVVVPDTLLESVMDRTFDAVVLPGGAEGSRRLNDDPRIKAILKRHHGQARLVAAICAAPLVLHATGLLRGLEATSHPSVKDRLTGVSFREDRVVEDRGVMTSQAAGTAMEFAFALVARLAGQAKADEVNAGVLARLA